MLSIIIPTKNEEQNIANCLESIKQQVFDKEEIEIIVVDNNSNDKTKEIVREYTLHHKDAGQAVKVFNVGSERSRQRNFGACQAQGKILGFIDADMILSPYVIAEVAKNFEHNKNLAGLYINEKIADFPTGFPPAGPAGSQGIPPLKGVGNFWCKIRDFERKFYSQTAIDAARFMLKEIFLSAGGFDENLFACEDWDLNKRIKKIAFAKSMDFDILSSVIYHNEAGMNFKKFLSKKKYYSASFQNYINKWGRDDADVKKQFSAYYRLAGVFVENGKWRSLLRHPVLAITMIIYKIIIGISWKFDIWN